MRLFLYWCTFACVCLVGIAQAETRVLTGTVTRTERVVDTSGYIGVDFRIRSGNYPLVIQVFRGSPAAQAGLLAGDEVLSIDGQAVQGHSLQAVDTAISDQPGTPVRFTVRRAGSLHSITVVVAPKPDGFLF